MYRYPFARRLGSKKSFVLAAVGLPIVAAACQLVIWPWMPPSPHLLFYPAVFVAARVRGLRAGYVATLLSALLETILFLPPVHSVSVAVSRDALSLVIFIGVGIVMSRTLGRLAEAVADERAARIAADETWTMIVHDLRTPLSTIDLAASQLARRLEQRGGSLERAARVIARSSARARALLQDGVDAVKIGEGSFTLAPGPCDVRELFARVLEDAAPVGAANGVRVDTDVATRRSIVCDEPRMLQALQNLVQNALKFTPRGGAVSLVADDDGDGVRITVRDTGRGIPEEDLPSIFTKHFSRSGSSGLGLWIAHSIVRAHGSEIGVESRENHGSAFFFTTVALADDRLP